METNEKIKKNGMLKVIIPLILIVTIVILAGLAYARYVTSIGGQTEVQIAQWNFNVTVGSNQSLNIDLADTRLANDTTEVDSSKVAPGTAGALQLNVNATGTQVSLEYDIDLSLTQIPENLIFYSDSNMTNAIYKENGIIHLDGYFGANDNNKTETKTLYWQWAMETGSTQAEIDANDLLDSAWMGDEIILGIQATGRQVMEENSTERQYAVTFDANGGTLQGYGNASQTTKMVTYGETYGDLPIPTRDGYTFAGWNGKNLFDYETNGYYSPANTKEVINGEKAFKRKNYTTNNIWPIFSNYDINFEEGKTYTISFDIWSDYETGFADYRFYINNRTLTYHNLTKISSKKQRMIGTFIFHKGDAINLHIYPLIQSDNNYYISNIQAEENSEATAYEPYYITTTTIVTKNNNHTLTAVWKEN